MKKIPQETELINVCKNFREEFEVPGFSLGVAYQDQVIFAEGFGYQDQEQQQKANANTIYGIASITKSFTALAIAILAQKGLLSFGDPVQKYLPEFQTPVDDLTKTITIHHFLTHTSALPPTGALRYAMIRSMENDPQLSIIKAKGELENWQDHPPIDNYEQLLTYLKNCDYQPLGQPGAQFSYQNDAYSLLGTIVERVSGIEYTQFVKENILQPLAMDNTAFDVAELPSSQLTTLYLKDLEQKTIPAPPWPQSPAMQGAGFLKSTVLDLLKYGNLYLNNHQELLAPHFKAMMDAPYFPCGRNAYYGYGLTVHPNYHGWKIVEHGGSLKGVASLFGYLPQKDISIAILTNLGEVPSSKVWMAAANLILDLAIDTPLSLEPQYQPSKEERERFIGRYLTDELADIEITAEDDKLYLIKDEQKQPLRISGPNTAEISYRGQKAGLEFFPGPDGKIKYLFAGLRLLRKRE